MMDWSRVGGPEMPAVGFAMGDVTLADLLESKQRLPDAVQAPQFVLIIGGSEARPVAMQDAARLRAQGFVVELPPQGAGLWQAVQGRQPGGARVALIYGSDEIASGRVKVRDLQAGTEQELSRERLCDWAAALLSLLRLEVWGYLSPLFTGRLNRLDLVAR